jgi:DNA invertase Pin-like site-specific DNA recombinase
MTINNTSFEEVQELAKRILAADPILNNKNRKGARTKVERRYVEDTLTGRKNIFRRVDCSKPCIIFRYRRISSLKVGSQTWERQEADIENAARIHNLDLTINVIDFSEEMSGSEGYRPQFEAMLNTIDSLETDNPIIVMVSDFDRIARNADVANEAIRIFRKQRVQLVIAANPWLDINDENMEQVISQFIWMAAFFSKGVKFKTTGGHLSRANKQQYRGTVPALGLATTRIQHPQFGDIPVYTPSTEPREDYPGKISEADLVKVIFQKYTEGVSKTRIARWLNGERYIDGKTVTGEEYRFPTQRGAELWSDQQVNNILHNVHYNGQYIFRGAAMLNEDGSPKKSHEAIINDELWETVQIMLDGTKHRRKPRRDSYRLSGLLTCANCGSRLSGKKAVGSSPHTYICGVSRLDKSKCVYNAISGPGIEAFVYDILLDMVSNNPERLADFAQRAISVEPSIERQDEIKSEIVELEGMREAILGTSRVAIAQRDSFNASIATAREELAGLVAAKQQYKMMTQVAFSGAKDFLEIWNSDDRVAMIMALKTIIKKVEIRPIETGKKLNQWDLKRLGWKVNLTRVRIVWIDETVTDGADLAALKKAPDA